MMEEAAQGLNVVYPHESNLTETNQLADEYYPQTNSEYKVQSLQDLQEAINFRFKEILHYHREKTLKRKRERERERRKRAKVNKDGENGVSSVDRSENMQEQVSAQTNPSNKDAITEDDVFKVLNSMAILNEEILEEANIKKKKDNILYQHRPENWRDIVKEYIMNKKEVLTCDRYKPYFLNYKNENVIRKTLDRWKLDYQKECSSHDNFQYKADECPIHLEHQIRDVLTYQIYTEHRRVDLESLRQVAKEIIQQNGYSHLLKEQGGKYTFSHTWCTRFWKKYQFPGVNTWQSLSNTMSDEAITTAKMTSDSSITNITTTNTTSEPSLLPPLLDASQDIPSSSLLSSDTISIGNEDPVIDYLINTTPIIDSLSATNNAENSIRNEPHPASLQEEPQSHQQPLPRISPQEDGHKQRIQDYLETATRYIAYYNIPPELVIATDEINIKFICRARKHQIQENSKRIQILGKGSERTQINCGIAITEAGQLLPIQLIFRGQTIRTIPKIQYHVDQYLVEADEYQQQQVSYDNTIKGELSHDYNDQQYHYHYHPAAYLQSQCGVCIRMYYSNFRQANNQTMETYRQWIEDIIVPYKNQIILDQKLPLNQVTLLKHDLHWAHKEPEILEILQQHYIKPLFVPLHCTEILSESIILMKKPFKEAVRRAFVVYLYELYDQHKALGGRAENFALSLTMGSIKAYIPGFVEYAYAEIAYNIKMRESIQKAFHEYGRFGLIRGNAKKLQSNLQNNITSDEVTVPEGIERDEEEGEHDNDNDHDHEEGNYSKDHEKDNYF
jgi:hypothetical protein